MTVLEAIQRSTEFLARKGVDSPRLQTELLLAHLLKLPRMRLYLEFERALEPGQVDAFRELVQRRGKREPLQYIVGSTSFCGLEIAVNRQVLIPRPETELLAERGWQFLNQILTLNSPASAGAAEGKGSASECSTAALDLGTGSGCLAIALAVNCPEARVVAVDVSAEALAVARQNAERHAVAERIQFMQGDWLAAVAAGSAYNLIISNAPYIATAELETIQPEVRQHEPKAALDGGADGLAYFRRLAIEAKDFLQGGGRLMLECGDGQAENVRDIFQREKWIVEAFHEDYTHRLRIAVLKREP